MNCAEEGNALPKTKWNIPQPLDHDIREGAFESGERN